MVTTSANPLLVGPSLCQWWIVVVATILVVSRSYSSLLLQHVCSLEANCCTVAVSCADPAMATASTAVVGGSAAAVRLQYE